MSTRATLLHTVSLLFTLAVAGCTSADPGAPAPADGSSDEIGPAELDAICELPDAQPFAGVVADRDWRAARGEARPLGDGLEARLYREDYPSCGDTCEAFIGFDLPSSVGDFVLPEGGASILGIDCKVVQTGPIWTVETGRVRVDVVDDSAVAGAACMHAQLDDGSSIDLAGTFTLTRCH